MLAFFIADHTTLFSCARAGSCVITLSIDTNKYYAEQTLNAVRKQYQWHNHSQQLQLAIETPVIIEVLIELPFSL